MSFEAYLARWAAARLLSWWSRSYRWSTASMVAIGALRWTLLGKPSTWKPKLQIQVDVTLAALKQQHVAELAPCCWGDLIGNATPIETLEQWRRA